MFVHVINNLVKWTRENVSRDVIREIMFRLFPSLNEIDILHLS